MRQGSSSACQCYGIARSFAPTLNFFLKKISASARTFADSGAEARGVLAAHNYAACHTYNSMRTQIQSSCCTQPRRLPQQQGQVKPSKAESGKQSIYVYTHTYIEEAAPVSPQVEAEQRRAQFFFNFFLLCQRRAKKRSSLFLLFF